MARNWWPYSGKKRPGWKGVGFCCNYRCMVGSSRGGLLVSLFLIVGLFAVYLAFPTRYYISKEHYWQPLIGISLFLASVSALLTTHLVDPGIIPPRPPPPSAWLRKHARACALHEHEEDPSESDTEPTTDADREATLERETEEILESFHSRVKPVPSGTPKLATAYCYTCHTWRTPRAVHCSDCGVGT